MPLGCGRFLSFLLFAYVGTARLLPLSHTCLVVLGGRLASAQLVNLGLPPSGLRKDTIHIGMLPDWSREGPLLINRALGGPISIIGDYVNVSPSDYSLSQVDYHLPEVVRTASGGVDAVYAPAIIYGSSLDTWTPAMTSAIAAKCKRVNSQGVVVWLRLLFEMNGAWMPYGQQQAAFLQVWKDVATAVRTQTNSTLMLWSPNIWSGDVTDPTQGYVPYWPGQDYVDIGGLSFYSFGFNKSVNEPPSSTLFRSLFTPYYNLLNPTSLNSSSSNLLGLTAPIPVVISETSAPFYYAINASSPYYNQTGDTGIEGTLPNTTTLTPSLASPPYSHSDDELFIKATWFVELSSNVTAGAFPNFRAASWFNYFKRGGSDSSPSLVDFRAVGGNTTVEAWFRGSIGNQTAYDLGYGSGSDKLAISGLCCLLAVGMVATGFI